MEIAQVLSPLTFAEFTKRHWGREFVVQSGPEARFRELFAWSELGQALASMEPLHAAPSSMEWREPRLRVIRQGRPVSIRPPFDFERLLRDQQCVLVVSDADEYFPALGRLAAEFEYAFRERTSVNLHAGYAGARGLPLHWDDHDVFVLQADGQQHWRVYGPTTEAPLDHGEDDTAPEDPLWEGTLTAGSLLYLPRGRWHHAESVEDAPSLHLTVSVSRATGVDLVAWLAGEVRKSAAFRGDVARLDDAAAQRAHARRLGEELRGLLDEQLVERFLAADDAAAPARRLGGLTGGRPGRLRFLPPRPVELRVEEAFGRFVEFEALGRSWHVPRWTEAVLRLLAERREIPRGEVRERVPEADPAIDYLIGVGLVEERSG